MVPNALKEQVNEKAKDTGLIDLFIFLLKYKWLFIGCILLAGIVTPLYLYMSTTASLPNKYYFSQCSISPNDYSIILPYDYRESSSISSRTENLKIILQSRDLSMMIAKENHLSMISHNIWDDKTNKWVTERLYVWDEQGGRLLKVRSGSTVDSGEEAALYININSQNNVLSVGFSSNEKDKSLKILDKYLSYISDFYRKRDIGILETQRNIYEQKLTIAKDTYQKVQLSEKIIEVTDKELRAKNDRYYGYNIMDPLYVIEVKPQEQITKGSITKEKSSTKRYIVITILFIMAAFVIVLALAGAIEYLTFIKKTDPEKYKILLKHLGFQQKD